MRHPFLSFIWIYRKIIIVILAPILLMPLPLTAGTQESSCGYVIILMAVYWITEALPLAVTSLIPLILFPLLGVLKASEVSMLYFKKANWLMFGGLMIAVAVECTGLHKRIALRALLIVGVSPRWLMFGIMSVTFFLSMWISNTATTAMLIPIVESIVKELYESDQQKESDDFSQDITTETPASGNMSYVNTAFQPTEPVEEESSGVDASIRTGPPIEKDDTSINVPQSESTEDQEKSLSKKRNISIIKGMTICVPYAASIGGTATLTGTIPNLVLSGQYSQIFPNASPKLSYGIWITYCLPQAIITMLLSYVWLSSWFIGFNGFRNCRKKDEANKNAESKAKLYIRNEYSKLGNMKWSETTVLVVFILTALLWFFREPGFMTGWSSVFLKGYVKDSTVAVAMAFLLFILPRTKPEFINAFKRGIRGEKCKSVEAILDWKTAQNMFPWDITLLLGAGFAIAGAATTSGLSGWFGEQLSGLKGVDDWIICLTMTTFICIMTETTSNTATSSLFVPILAELAKTLEVHPLYLLLPPIIAASFAFMLPVATPPNAIAFSYGRITVWDLVKAGWMVNIIGILTITLSINTYGMAFFNLSEFPTWANSTIQAAVNDNSAA